MQQQQQGRHEMLQPILEISRRLCSNTTEVNTVQRLCKGLAYICQRMAKADSVTIIRAKKKEFGSDRLSRCLPSTSFRYFLSAITDFPSQILGIIIISAVGCPDHHFPHLETACIHREAVAAVARLDNYFRKRFDVVFIVCMFLYLAVFVIKDIFFKLKKCLLSVKYSIYNITILIVLSCNGDGRTTPCISLH